MLLDVYDTISWVIGGITLVIALVTLSITIISLIKTNRQANKQIQALQETNNKDNQK